MSLVRYYARPLRRSCEGPARLQLLRISCSCAKPVRCSCEAPARLRRCLRGPSVASRGLMRSFCEDSTRLHARAMWGVCETPSKTFRSLCTAPARRPRVSSERLSRHLLGSCKASCEAPVKPLRGLARALPGAHALVRASSLPSPPPSPSDGRSCSHALSLPPSPFFPLFPCPVFLLLFALSAPPLPSPALPPSSCDASVRPHTRFCEDCARLLRRSRMAPARLVRSMRGSSEARCEVPAKLLRGPCEGSAKPLRGLCEVRRIARTGPARLPRGFSEVCEAHRGFCEAPAKLLRAPCEGSARLLRGSCEAS